MFKEHLEYIKDNPNRYWFKRKLYGFGWVAATWQGYLASIFLITLLVVDFMWVYEKYIKIEDTLKEFALHAIGIFIAFILVCYKKSEKPRWQWGVPKK